MMTIKTMLPLAAMLAAVLAGSPAQAALTAPTPAQQQAAAAKKAQAEAQAAKDKANLAASMDAVSSRWRGRAAQQGWKTHAPVAIAAAAPATAAGPAAAGAGASGIVTAAGAGGQPAGQLPVSVANPIVKSEKFGTAPPSSDYKAGPTKALPRGAAPTVQKGLPTDVSKK
jgi:hypothetical protein